MFSDSEKRSQYIGAGMAFLALPAGYFINAVWASLFLFSGIAVTVRGVFPTLFLKPKRGNRQISAPGDSLWSWLVAAVVVAGSTYAAYLIYARKLKATPYLSYDISDPSRRDRFSAWVKQEWVLDPMVRKFRATQPKPKSGVLRITCLSWSERSCVAAANFMPLLSEAGWTIEGNRVCRSDSPRPREGIEIASRATNPDAARKRPPHLGEWSKLTPLQLGLAVAFSKIDIPVNTVVDADLAADIIGVYFGIEPRTAGDRPGLWLGLIVK